MRVSCRLLGELLVALKPMVKPGANADELEQFTLDWMNERHVIPAFKGYHGYEYALCVSMNEEIVHGFPLKSKVFREGDIVSVDMGLIYEGAYSDTAYTFPVGPVKPEILRLLQVTFDSLYAGLGQAVAGRRLTDISHAVQTVVEGGGYSVVRELYGHGVGIELHEEPLIPNYGLPGQGPVLKPGMTLAIEVMVNEGKAAMRTLDDGWTIVTKDGSRSAHYEHTIVITPQGPPEILTDCAVWKEPIG